MKKSSYIALVLIIFGVLLFGTGMSMALVPEIDMFNLGVVLGSIGFVITLITVIVYRKVEDKAPIRVSARTMKISLVVLVGALTLGGGMSLILVYEEFIIGMILGIVGIVTLLLLIPVIKGLE